ncbi:ankyrin repeat domain-containing protein [Salinisphaera sp. G21_0]|uniref:ankyrin repeat domain-containing protein n=1 Tax=Salinisphaera sp. G21_0 TaxID=2821094 RepID=UPI001ADCDD10|nr:ankyrin repeat domain-containing protein [Salinisphaera sp. G21_0]MBO9482155.1 ankyrin repeat domain-containing protein [Salinisphaera sp. G21_0]
MFSSVRTEHDHSQEMVADASVESTSAVDLPLPDNTTEVDHSESAVAVSGSRQLPAATTDMAKLMERAILRNDLATVNYLLDQGVDPNIRDAGGSTPLYWAVGRLEDTDIVKALLDRRADPNLHIPYLEGKYTTPFLEAAKLGNYKTLNLLLDRGADLNASDDDGRTALHLATFSSDATAITKIVNCLLDRGAYINAIDCTSHTPLLLAVIGCKISGVNTLLQGGADPDIPDPWGQTPLNWTLHYYLHFNISSLFHSVLANGANPNKPGSLGNTPLHRALQHGWPEIVDSLLANGAHTNIPNASGETALDIAAARGVVDALHNYIPAYQPMRLMACARTCIRSRLVENRVPLAKVLASGSDCLPLPYPMKNYLYQPLTYSGSALKAGN